MYFKYKIPFIDETTVCVVAGKGGNGCLSFLREKHRPKGGPDGGNGGDGGSIYLKGNSRLNTLSQFRYKRLYKATNGKNGEGKYRFGKQGVDLVIDVPLGTSVSDFKTGESIGDILSECDRLLVARGGKFGLGNARFKSSINRTPRVSTPGQLGDERIIKLELKILADVGLLGLPNSGKSTFLRAVSKARPKIGDYPFTTLYPELGVVEIEQMSSFVVADIPGLIQGASGGAGLGQRFLKHLQRTRILLHLVDISAVENFQLIDAIQVVENEINNFTESLSRIERWIILTKIDLIDHDTVSKICYKLIKNLRIDTPVYAISAATGIGVGQLNRDLLTRLNEI